MPIKWDPTLVNEDLDRMDALLLEAYPNLEDAAKGERQRPRFRAYSST